MKITVEVCLKVKERLQNGETKYSIAKDMEFSHHTVGRIKTYMENSENYESSDDYTKLKDHFIMDVIGYGDQGIQGLWSENALKKLVHEHLNNSSFDYVSVLVDNKILLDTSTLEYIAGKQDIKGKLRCNKYYKKILEENSGTNNEVWFISCSQLSFITYIYFTDSYHIKLDGTYNYYVVRATTTCGKYVFRCYKSGSSSDKINRFISSFADYAMPVPDKKYYLIILEDDIKCCRALKRSYASNTIRVEMPFVDKGKIKNRIKNINSHLSRRLSDNEISEILAAVSDKHLTITEITKKFKITESRIDLLKERDVKKRELLNP